MMGALIMTETKIAERGGALVANAVRRERVRVIICVDGGLTGTLLGLATSPRRNPRKTCARSGPKSRPRRCLQISQQARVIETATRLADLTDDSGGREGENEGLTNTRSDSDKTRVLVPNEVSHVCIMSKVEVAGEGKSGVEMNDGEHCSKGM